MYIHMFSFYEHASLYHHVASISVIEAKYYVGHFLVVGT